MGYYAPDADEVYQYICRSGKYSPKTLSDGFSWSILFINDKSPVCREFLAKYGMELCYRTADRIRFVFFSNLDPLATREIVRQVEYSNKLPNFLRGIIEKVAGWGRDRRSYDWEEEPWHRLRPELFYPLHSRDLIRNKIDMEVEMHAAVPGNGEALQLAQRLGIGRFVPCFLFFADIGKPSIYILPAGNYPADQLYREIRHLIDSFYEINHDLLADWKETEEQIEKVCQRFTNSVYTVNEWVGNRARHWNNLKKLTGYLTALNEGEFEPTLIDQIEKDGQLKEAHECIRVFIHRLHSLDAMLTYSVALGHWRDALLSKPIEKINARSFANLPYGHGVALPASITAALSEAAGIFESPATPPSTSSEIRKWWQSGNGSAPVRKQYSQQRQAWEKYSRARYGDAAIGNVGSILKEEMQIVRDSAFSQSINCVPEEAADTTVGNLARHFGVDAEDGDWKEAISPYRTFLVSYFSGLQRTAPAWLFHLKEKENGDLRWGEIIPGTDQRNSCSLPECLRLLPLLSGLIDREEQKRELKKDSWEIELLERKKKSIGSLSAAVGDWISSMRLIRSDKESLYGSLVAALWGYRKQLEDKIFADSKTLLSASHPVKPFTREEMTDFLRSLDDYTKAVNSVVLPFEKHPEVLMFDLRRTLSDLLGVRTEAERSAMEEVKRSVKEAVTRAENSNEDWNAIRSGTTVYSPGGTLTVTLKQIVRSDRWKELLSLINVPDQDSAAQVLSDRGEIISFLQRLNVSELTALERTLQGNKKSADKVGAATKQAIFDSILSAIGLLSDGMQQRSSNPMIPTEGLKEKVRDGAFDVFLAHNSSDKAAVLELGRLLRNRNIYPWIDVEQIPPGRWYQEVIQSAVRKIASAAVVIGKEGLGVWQSAELRVFVNRCITENMPLIPVLLPGVKEIPKDLAFLRELQQVRFAEHLEEENTLTALVWGVSGKGRPPR